MRELIRIDEKYMIGIYQIGGLEKEKEICYPKLRPIFEIMYKTNNYLANTKTMNT